ncbi:type IV pilin protein [Thauera butanivorans]|uniref:type IV pilin protein n=1 Tax=Thauera butanivorans TaxID=86174 RepID=UPI0008382949|nr:type IV pilin protein [Thauera butanivorans]
MKKAQGFTLIEIMIVVVIIGILASIAVPSYNDYIMRSKLIEATSELSTARVRLEQYFQDNRQYAHSEDGDECGVDMPAAPSVRYFTYACVPSADGQQYTITATGVSAQGTGGFVYTLNQDNAKDTTGAPTGWGKADGTAPGCWITRRGGAC